MAAPAFPVLLRIPRLRVSEAEPVVAKPPIARVASPSLPVPPSRKRERRPTLTFAIFLLVVVAPAYWYVCTLPNTRKQEPPPVEMGEVMILPAPGEPVEDELDGAVAPQTEPTGIQAELLPDIVPLDEGEL
ncbi:MAG: hypothetical protein AB7K24_27370 [Gemmataceae bacterium]